MAEQTGWIGVDLDGTLARYDGWISPDHIGEPIPIMLERVKQWIADGIIVKIFTARCGIPEQVAPIAAWLEKYGIGGLEITNVKDFSMMELWDDRAVRVLSQKYQLSVLIGVDFWSTDAALSQSTESARRVLAFRLYGGINELVEELRMAIHGGDRRRALYACDMIDKYIKP